MSSTDRIPAYKKSTKAGEVINFSIDGKKYAMWPNKFKSKENQPDFLIVEDFYKPKISAYDKLPTDKEYLKNARKH